MDGKTNPQSYELWKGTDREGEVGRGKREIREGGDKDLSEFIIYLY